MEASESRQATAYGTLDPTWIIYGSDRAFRRHSERHTAGWSSVETPSPGRPVRDLCFDGSDVAVRFWSRSNPVLLPADRYSGAVPQTARRVCYTWLTNVATLLFWGHTELERC